MGDRCRLALWLAASALAAGCASAPSPDPQIAADREAGIERMTAKRLEGPFDSVAEFCSLLGATRCTPRESAVRFVGASPVLRTSGGVDLRLLPVVTQHPSDKERLWVLIQRGETVWALPPIVEYAIGVAPEITVGVFEQSPQAAPELIELGWEVSFSDAGHVESHGASELCLASPQEAVVCAHVVTHESVRGADEPTPIEAPGVVTVEVLEGDLVELQESTGRGDATGRRVRIVRP